MSANGIGGLDPTAGNIARWYTPGESVPAIVRDMPRLRAETGPAFRRATSTVTVTLWLDEKFLRRLAVPVTNLHWWWSRGSTDADVRRAVRALLEDPAEVAVLLLAASDDAP